jgi:UDP-N-acetyl-2-amino-2-deoxyglucuronate dehydrogenase
MSTLRFALVGAGFIGAVHARELAGLDEAELVAVVDTDPPKAEALATRYGAPVATTDMDAVLRRDDVDAVSICTPTGVHADGAVAALDAGKHVVVEKPLDVTLAAADRVIDAEKRSGKTVAVISQHRFDRSARRSSRPSATGISARSPLPLPRTPGGAGSRTTTPVTGGAPGRSTAAARS